MAFRNTFGNVFRNVLVPVTGESGGFLPDQLTGLIIWLDADDAATITEVGGDVSQWDDKSGNGNNASQPTVSWRPSTAVVTIGGLNALNFDGANDHLIGSGGFDIPLSDHTIFCVLRTEAILAQTNTSMLAWNASQGLPENSEVLFITNTAGFLEAIIDGGAFFALINEDIRGQDLFVSLAIDHGNTITTRLNGVEKSDRSINAVVLSDHFTIMAELDVLSAGNFLNGALGEIVIYSRLLPASEIDQVEQYLSFKWGVALP